MTISVYTELGSLFDERRGIITKVALESGYTKFDWDRNFKEIYARRRMDVFNQPELGITQEAYDKRYEQRSVYDIADETQVYIRPSKLIYNMFKVVRELEFGVGQIISDDKFSVTVNVWPYDLSDDMVDELRDVMKGAVIFNYDVSFVSMTPEELTPAVLHGFQYVFKYDMLLSPRMKTYWESYARSPNSNVRFIVPDVLINRELPEEMRSEEPINLISNLNVAQGGKITLVPISKTIFDYKE